MKQLQYKILLLTAATIGYFLLSCNKAEDFLDKRTGDILNETKTFADSGRASEFLTAIYQDLAFSFNPNNFRQSGFHSGCDESNAGRDRLNINLTYNLVTGGLNSVNVTAQNETLTWRPCWAQIRRVNMLLKNLDRVPVADNTKSTMKGEARFLRAWYYAMMLKYYGGVPLIGDTVYSGDDQISGKRNAYEECVNYITSECDAAAELLPLSWTGNNYGRITKGACLALKARVLLYAASPLFNGGGIATDPELKAITGYPANDANRWKLAADAAEAVIALNNYSLMENNSPTPGYGFYLVPVTRFTGQTEIILPLLQANNRNLEGIWRPASRGNSRPSALPYQELVDAFGMKNGKLIDEPGSNYDPNDPYANRDPRFYFTIAYNGSLMYDNSTRTKKPINTTYQANPDGYGINEAYTGYFINKMLGETVTATLNGADHNYPLIRYAEVLLNAAEAINEYNGPTPRVYELLEMIRKRAGLNPYTLPSGLTQQEMRDRIRNERRVELAFEEHRFWDVRRWMIAEQTENKMMHGMKITPKTGGGFNYEVVPVMQHYFKPHMYLFPFPIGEINKSDELLQNPGW